ncbi:hypothetical protein K7I13_10795 [Brucepastera parasyntrophica]|uniref:amylo-alpha-1,6-glucosidase n=1 Tax=Brucepastera parasyntrophica TaxID=2880008 RepID=UPI0021093B0A|nr:amylo-alpha-1,6-glucosidase [Brucepastera parasyntrophica]ULQ58998.1 hypothetical protein K7I13_10795 [Brucepastera parasyntrophica]
MKIRLEQGSGRLFSWTDRRNGYMVLNSDVAGDGSGYFRGNRRLLSDFFISAEHTFREESVSAGAEKQPVITDLYRTEAEYTDIYPHGFSAYFEFLHAGITCDVSLLVDEQAFYIGLKSSGEKKDRLIKNVGAGILLGSEDSPDENNEEDEDSSDFEDLPLQKKPVLQESAVTDEGLHAYTWERSTIGEITVWHNQEGCAIAAHFPFELKPSYMNGVVLFPEAGGSESSGPYSLHEWYVVFEDDAEQAVEKSLRLVQTRAILKHKETIEKFLQACCSRSGDTEFDNALKWAQFSGWMLATKDKEETPRGIWAGLPWFRENWGRDTFIALPGILLVSGCFSEARDVLLGFARYQSRDPDDPNYGRIPNRYRNADDVIFNTADGTLWFIRAIWEYVQYSGDSSILDELKYTVFAALDADMRRRTDNHGFLLHGDADTWMDARIRGDAPWSPRGNRACDIQALWFTALRIGVRLALRESDAKTASQYDELSKKLKKSFLEFFWNPGRSALADRLPPGESGEKTGDFRVRPNQLFAITAPSVLGPDPSEDDSLLPPDIAYQILENVDRELLSPFGLFSLCPDDPFFHPNHEDPEHYHKDAAYHNGTIWVWNTGPYVTASALAGRETAKLQDTAAALIKNEALMICGTGCVGSLSENIHAQPDAERNPVLSGTFSQAWSVSEFARNIYQDIIGFNPCLFDNSIIFRPRLPAGTESWEAKLPFGPGWLMNVRISRTKTKTAEHGHLCTLLWEPGGGTGVPLPELYVNGIAIQPGKFLSLVIDEKGTHTVSGAFITIEEQSSSLLKNHAWVIRGFPHHDLRPDWCGAIHQVNYLERLILSGRLDSPYGGENAAALEWFFDSWLFRKKYVTEKKLGVHYTPERTVFRLWAPTARDVGLILYPDGTDSGLSLQLHMRKVLPETSETGMWEVSVPGDLYGTYYQFRVRVHGIIRNSPDPYARACGINGHRSMVADFARTNPSDWDAVKIPVLDSPNDAVVYEVHVADITSSDSWKGDPAVKRTYAGAVTPGVTCRGLPAGFDHICGMGISHIQILPVFDFSSVDESRIKDPSYAKKITGGLFNWGYDPGNYSAPEGSYSSDPYTGETRIRELKNLIKNIRNRGSE